ncbi:MAG: membrane dipeptidase [Ardenticatenales bacterium]|nr:membrane dipeptidase [Ardenticatenales bacterium]
MIIVDAHEDLAWNILTFGRDYLQPVAQTRARELGGEAALHNGQTLIGWPEWIQGNVAVVFATLFVSPTNHRMGEWDRACYENAEEAHRLYRAQLDVYHRLVAEHPDKLQLLTTRGELASLLAGWESGPPEQRRVGLVILMEGADGVREPDEIEQWFEWGVRLVGPAWVGTRYAGGTGAPGPLTAEGHALLRRMAELGMVLDLSHLAEEATQNALAEYQGTIIASHSNPRGLAPESPRADRYLSDETIRHLAQRDGVIGVVPFNYFIKESWRPEQGRAGVTLADVVRHIDYICQLTGSAAHVGIGTDFDGGFGLDKVPLEFNSVADLPRLGDALAAHGYDSAQIEGILGGNWLRMLYRSLPE